MPTAMKDRIWARIEALGPGKAFIAKDFLDIASRGSIDVALASLTSAGKIRRIRRGLYDLPIMNPGLGGELSPDIDEAARTIARRIRWIIIPDGPWAANLVGLTVSGVDPEGRISLEDGRVLPAGFRHFTHGYAVTAHRSQGQSVDAVIISGDGMRKELFYVAASRGRQSVQVITSDKESLRESVARSSARKSASELARKAGNVLMRSAHRGIIAARQLAMRLSMRETELAPAEIYQHEFRKEQRRERDFGR
jgi:hypothetical protein